MLELKRHHNVLLIKADKLDPNLETDTVAFDDDNTVRIENGKVIVDDRYGLHNIPNPAFENNWYAISLTSPKKARQLAKTIKALVKETICPK